VSAENLGFLRDTIPVSGLLATPKTDKHRPLSYLSIHAWYWLKCFFAADLQSTVMAVLYRSIFTIITLVHRPVVDCCTANPQQIRVVEFGFLWQWHSARKRTWANSTTLSIRHVPNFKWRHLWNESSDRLVLSDIVRDYVFTFFFQNPKNATFNVFWSVM